MIAFAKRGLPIGAFAAAGGLVAAYGGCGDAITSVALDAGGDETRAEADVADSDAWALDSSSGDAGVGDAHAMNLDCNGPDAAFGPPSDLGCTGLYAEWRTRALNPEVKRFDPGLVQWNDGATETFWVRIPPGTKIDTSDMNEWRFPVGFKAWQELDVHGKRTETRHLWKRGDDDWVRTTYRWSDDETSAVSLTAGATDVGSTGHAIPPVSQCDACHGGRLDKVLGLEAVIASSPASRFDGQSPAIAGLAPYVTALPDAPLDVPNDATGRAADALGWLHANCGTSCHNANRTALGRTSGLLLRLEIGPGGLGSYEGTSTYRTAVCKRAAFRETATATAWTRIRPHEAWTKSLVAYREDRRGDPLVGMPPFASRTSDPWGSRLLRDWIVNGSFPTQTGPGETCSY